MRKRPIREPTPKKAPLKEPPAPKKPPIKEPPRRKGLPPIGDPPKKRRPPNSFKTFFLERSPLLELTTIELTARVIPLGGFRACKGVRHICPTKKPVAIGQCILPVTDCPIPISHGTSTATSDAALRQSS